MKKKAKWTKSDLKDLGYEHLLAIAMDSEDPSAKALVLDHLAERAAANARKQAERDISTIKDMPNWDLERLVMVIRECGDLSGAATAEYRRRKTKP